MKKYKVIKAIDIGNIRYSPGIVVYGEMDIVKFLKENNLVDKYLEEVEPKLSYKPFSPKEEEKYFYVSPSGRVLSGTYYSGGSYYSDGITYKWNDESGNCFRTKEEAEYHRDWLIARKRIMDSSDSESAWENQEQKKLAIYYNHANKRLKVIDWFYGKYGSLPTYKSEEEAEQATQDLEDEYLVYFGVKRKLED